MTDRPILFSGPMVNAILEGRKTQTRRVLKEQPESGVRCQGQDRDGFWLFSKGPFFEKIKLPYQVGDRLCWVKEAHFAYGHWEKTQGLTKMGREKWKFVRDFDKGVLFYAPSNIAPDRAHLGWHKRSSLFMFRADSRLTLVVTDVRVQRLQEISVTDSIAEGINPSGINTLHPAQLAITEFHTLWDSINDARDFGWDSNPWVVAVTFETHHGNIDQMEAVNE